MKRKATDSGNAIGATPSKRNRGPVKGSEAPSEKQTSRSSVATLSIEDPLASTSDSKRSSTVPRSTMPTSPDMFPRFSAGTVNVQLSEEPNGQYQLHRAVLERSSTWFGRALQKNAETRESSNFRFILRQTPGQVIPMLFKMVIAMASSRAGHILTAIQNGSPQGGRPGTVGTTPSSTDVVVPRPQASSQRMPLDRRSSTAASIDLTSSDEARSEVLPEAKAGVKKDVDNNREVQVKQEPQERPLASTSAPEAQQPTTNAPSAPGGSLDTEPALEQQKLFQQFVDAYEGLLSMFYHIAPKMSTSDINCALVQCEKIVKLAMIYGSLPIVRPYLGSVLSEYHVKLYTAIAQDPPRWLLLGIALESGLIFRESMTHCAGSYPSCTWKTQFSALPANVRSIITKKSEWLARLRSQVNEELLLNTLCESDGRPVSMITSPEAWMVVQIFRDWLAKRIQHQRETHTLHYGSLYRMMARGGNAYLPTKDITNLVEGANLSGKLMDEWEGVEGDLKMIKTFAKNAVAQLVKSNVLVSPLELGIPYLTCVEVGEADFPWTTQLDANAGENAA